LPGRHISSRLRSPMVRFGCRSPLRHRLPLPVTTTWILPGHHHGRNSLLRWVILDARCHAHRARCTPSTHTRFHHAHRMKACSTTTTALYAPARTVRLPTKDFAYTRSGFAILAHGHHRTSPALHYTKCLHRCGLPHANTYTFILVGPSGPHLRRLPPCRRDDFHRHPLRSFHLLALDTTTAVATFRCGYCCRTASLSRNCTAGYIRTLFFPRPEGQHTVSLRAHIYATTSRAVRGSFFRHRLPGQLLDATFSAYGHSLPHIHCRLSPPPHPYIFPQLRARAFCLARLRHHHRYGFHGYAPRSRATLAFYCTLRTTVPLRARPIAYYLPGLRYTGCRYTFHVLRLSFHVPHWTFTTTHCHTIHTLFHAHTHTILPQFATFVCPSGHPIYIYVLRFTYTLRGRSGHCLQFHIRV